MSIVQISPTDAAWLLLESRETPMHVGGLLEFTRPRDAPPTYLKLQLERMRATRTLPRPWNLKPLEAPLVGTHLPLHPIHMYADDGQSTLNGFASLGRPASRAVRAAIQHAFATSSTSTVRCGRCT